jgi:serine/threonine protein kinase
MSEGWQYESELAGFFPVSPEGNSTRNEHFSNDEIARITAVLEHNGRESWARVVRTYVCLRISQALRHIDTIIQTGVNDISIPYTSNNLPSELLPVERSRFLKAQQLVYTHLFQLEWGSSGKHQHIPSRDACQFETRAVIARGQFGQVEKVYSKLGQRLYAMKLLRRKKTFKNDQISLKCFVNELAASKKVDHRHVVKVVGSFTEPSYIGIIMGTIGECNLQTFLEQDMDEDRLSLTRTFFGCLASGLIAIHNANIRHKDIKPQNIIKKGDMVMYTDFGIALDYSQTDRSTTGGQPAMFTAQFCAPEVADWQDRRSSSDVFSLGAVYLEMATRLNGESVDNLRNFLKSENEFNNAEYCKNLDSIQKWANMMKERVGLKIDKTPFGWIEGCLKQNERERPTVHRLWEQIEEDTDVSSFPFACSACTVQYDSTASEANFSDEKEEIENNVGTLSSGDLVERSRFPRSFQGNAASAISTNLSSDDLKTYSEGEGLLTITSPNIPATHHLRTHQNQGGTLLDLQASSSSGAKLTLANLIQIPTFNELHPQTTKFDLLKDFQTPVPYGLKVSTTSQSGVNASGRPFSGDNDTFDRVEHLGWDQFKGLTTDYEESFYTTTIDRNHPLYMQRAARAEKIAREIEGSASLEPQAFRDKQSHDGDATNKKYVQPCLYHEFTLRFSAPALKQMIYALVTQRVQTS